MNYGSGFPFRLALSSAALFLLTCPGLSQLGRTLRCSGATEVSVNLLGDRFAPHWCGQTLLGVEDNDSDEPLIYSINRDGHREQIRFGLADAGNIAITGISCGSDGAIVAIGSCWSRDSRATTFFARISPDRRDKTVVRLWPYVPKAVAVAPNGTIWTVGWVRDGERVSQNNVLRYFDSSGAMLGSFRVRAPKQRKDGNFEVTELSYLRASHDRVGWYTRGNQYIEFSPDGTELGRFDGPDRKSDAFEGVFGVALSKDNEVIVEVAPRTGTAPARLLALDRAKRSWNSLSLPDDAVSIWKASGWIATLGFDGGDLVLSSRGILRRYAIEAAPNGH